MTVAINDSMADANDHWDTGTFGATARLEFVDDVYRMTAGGWPLISPSKDTRTVGLDPVSIEAAFGRVVGTGLDSTVSEHPPAAEIWQPGRRSIVEAHCERGAGVDQALLELSVDGRKVAEAQSSNGAPTGQVGLVAVSRSEDPLVVDVLTVTVRSPR